MTDTRGPQSEPQAKPQSTSKQKQKPAVDETATEAKAKSKDAAGQPYHPPQAYAAPKKPGAQRGPVPGTRTTPRTRKARLRVAKADPWSVMKVSFLLSIALGVCTIVASAVLWMVMDAMGIFSTVGGTISEATGSNEGNGFDLQSFLSLPRVLIFTSVIAVIDVVLMTALATLGAFIYNLSAGFVGGVELTLAEDE
ncbi:membrane protein [Streptomyces katrae]|uniref:Membrane protein n=1 Tax=Streptomyces katrae TaxID=68223 RepID=A0A0F4K1B1_9ACTN|nr:membrane protein [Streptomyces katrae]